MANNAIELKDWRRHLQHSLDKLRDHFCRQYVLNFIYSRDGEARLDAQIYLHGKGDDPIWDSNLPSLPFQALFGKLQQLATVAGDVGCFCSSSAIRVAADMHFTVEIARFAGYPSRHIHQIASSIITRAIRTFSARGINPQSALPADEWFAETAKTAIHKLLQGASGSDTSDIDEDHIAMDDEHIMMNDEQFSDTDESPSSLSTVDSFESFASAQMGELESPVYLSDPED
ncbi:Exocyst complex component EXO84C [Camellia lanceoleosa]|uniref:Exocyst complex component EXO84C n=1 Tax=Camellia lanceoleosa TaxID=1840588 RepID=A0ACC0HDS8_9ERIC|nr:Exocyst complex component EXO84C [Camellia lanceoleosa]